MAALCSAWKRLKIEIFGLTNLVLEACVPSSRNKSGETPLESEAYQYQPWRTRNADDAHASDSTTLPLLNLDSVDLDQDIAQQEEEEVV